MLESKAMLRARILIVDDESSSIEIMRRYLTAKGHECDGAGDCDAARRSLERKSYDLVLLDMILPDRTGFQALPELRRAGAATILAMSGQTDDDTRRDAMLLGADGFLPKPLDLPALCALIDSLPEKSG